MAARIEEAQAWLLLADWVNTREGAADPSISAALEAALATIDPQAISVAESIFEGHLGGYDLGDWESFRARRLVTTLEQEVPASGGPTDEVEIPHFLRKRRN